MLPGLQQALTSTPPTSATTKSASSSSSISRVAELPALLLEAKARKAQVERETLQLKEHLHSQLLHDLMRCKEMTSLVSQLLIDHKRNDQPRVLHAKLHWLASVSNVMRLKAQVLANELTVETYPPHKLEILRATQYVVMTFRRSHSAHGHPTTLSTFCLCLVFLTLSLAAPNCRSEDRKRSRSETRYGIVIPCTDRLWCLQWLRFSNMCVLFVFSSRPSCSCTDMPMRSTSPLRKSMVRSCKASRKRRIGSIPSRCDL